MKRKFLPLLLTVVLVVAAAVVPMLTLTASAEDGTWELVTDASTLAAGDQVVIVSNTKGTVAGDITSQYMSSVSVTFDSSSIATLPAKAAVLTIGGSADKWTFANASGKLLGATDVKKVAWGSGTTTWKITIADGNATIQSTNSSYGRFLYNVNNPRFTTYTSNPSSSMVLPQIYKFVPAVAGDCEHANTSIKEVLPTKGDAGYRVEVCDDCGVEVGTKEILPALGYEVNFVVPDGVETPANQTTISATMPDSSVIPSKYNKYEYVFAGWAKSTIDGETEEKPVIYKAGTPVPITEDTTFYAVYTWSFGDTSNNGWVETDVNEIGSSDIVVMVWTSSKGAYAVTNGNGTGSAPAAVAVTIEGGKITSDIADNLKWNIVNDSGSLNIHPNGSTSTWLYCTSTNNGVRVGNNDAKAFTIDSSSGYLKHTGTGRYLGIYNAQDLRCYTTSTTTNIANQTVAFYVLVSGGSTFYATTLEAAAACTHDDTTTDTQNATCTESGTITVTCNLCGTIVSVESIDKLEHAYGEGVVTTPATCTKKGVMTFTCENDATHTYTEDIDMLDHNLGSYNVCYDCGYLNATTSGTDYSGTYYVSTTRTNESIWYMTNTLNSGKRYAATTVLAEATEVTFVKNEDGTYLIYVLVGGEANYLGWQSENTGIFVSEENAIKFTVVVTNGYYNVYFAAGDGNRYLSLNSTSGSDYFAFYKGTQKQDLTLTPTEAESETPDSYFSGASLALGSTLTLNYYVSIPGDADIADYKVVFTLENGKVVTVTEAIYDEATGEYKFALTGIAPQNYQVNVSAALYLNDEVVFEKTEYSVETAAMGYLTTKSTAILAQALLEYCVAAADYVDEDDDANYTEDRVIETNPGKSITNNEKVTAVGVNFDYVNKIYVKLNADATVTFNDVAAKVEDLGNGVYIAYSDALTALQFNDTVTIVVDDTTTVTYSVNAYAYTKQNAENVEMANLAITLYYYGAAAEAYKAN